MLIPNKETSKLLSNVLGFRDLVPFYSSMLEMLSFEFNVGEAGSQQIDPQ